MSYVTLGKVNKMNITEMEVDVNRLREHLVAFLAHHDPKRLQTSMKIDKMVKFAEEKGIEMLNQKLLHRFGDQVDTTTKLGTPKERILRLCKGFTPTLTRKLMEKAKIQPKLTSSLKNEEFSNEDTELLNQIYFFYLEHNPEKLEHLAKFFEFAKGKGREALNKILKASYDHELPPATTQRDQKVHEHAQELMSKSSKTRPSSLNSSVKMDLNLKNEIRDYFDEVDPSKLKAANTLYYWIELMGKEKASEVFLRLYGKAFAEGSTTEPIRVLRKTLSRNRKSGRLGDHSGYETPLPTKPSSSANIRFKKNFDNTPPKVAREIKKQKIKNRSIQPPVLNPHVRHNSYADPFLAERRDSYLNSPALFMRNIPNIALIKETAEESSRRLNQSMGDFDDDSNDVPSNFPASPQFNYDIAEMMKKSPLGKLKEEDRDDSSFGSFVSSQHIKKKKGFAQQLFNKLSPAKKHRKPDFDLNNLTRLADIQRPENAHFDDHDPPLRPHFDSVVASPIGNKNAHNVSKGRQYLHGPNEYTSDARSPSFMRNFVPDENEPLPIKSLKRPNKDANKRFSVDNSVESTSPPNSTVRKISDVSSSRRKKPMKEIRRKKNPEEDIHQKGCRQFVGMGRYCDQCGSDKVDHEWYAFDLPKALVDSARAKNKNSPLLDDSEI